MRVTQEEIDNAVIIGKGAVADLANELYLERKFGGKIDCCSCTLGVLWGWVKVLSCIREVVTEEVLAEGFVEYTSVATQNTIRIFVDGVDISGAISLGSTSVSAAMTATVSAINGHQATYVASAVSGGKLKIVGTCENQTITFTNSGGPTPTLAITQFEGGKCEYSEDNNCLSVEETKVLIGKVNSLCTNDSTTGS